MWLLDDGFYEFDELLIINLITFVIALLLTMFKWMQHFYKKWKTSEISLKDSDRKFNELTSSLDKASGSVKAIRKNSFHQIKISDIRLAKSEFGVVKIITEDQKFFIFSGTLSELATFLPEQIFFPVTRSIVLHKEMIVSMSPSSYGKILLKTKIKNDSEVTISRLKASTFRKWYNGSSALN